MRLLRAGDHAVLVELGDNVAVHRFASAVRERLGDIVEDVVPGHETLLVSWVPGVDATSDFEQLLADISTLAPARASARVVTVPVVYDGPDLDEVARTTGLAVQDVCELHAAATYTAAFIGFSPGFAYLLGGDRQLQLPRRPSPRVKVPAGAVAIAGPYSAIYPSDGPGGWQLLGRTDLTLFDPAAADPFLIEPGTQVHFEPVS